MAHTERRGSECLNPNKEALFVIHREVGLTPENSLRINSFMETVLRVTRLKSEVVAGVGLGKVLRHGAG